MATAGGAPYPTFCSCPLWQGGALAERSSTAISWSLSLAFPVWAWPQRNWAILLDICNSATKADTGQRSKIKGGLTADTGGPPTQVECCRHGSRVPTRHAIVRIVPPLRWSHGGMWRCVVRSPVSWVVIVSPTAGAILRQCLRGETSFTATDTVCIPPIYCALAGLSDTSHDQLPRDDI